jgi:hypothetical protein
MITALGDPMAVLGGVPSFPIFSGLRCLALKAVTYCLSHGTGHCTYFTLGLEVMATVC